MERENIMAVRNVQKKNLSCVELIVRCDEVIGEDADYDAYLKDLDEKHLKLTGEPSRFVLNLELKSGEGQRVKNAMLGGRDDDGDPKLTYGSWSFSVAKVALKDIKNPPDFPLETSFVMKKDGAGNVHDDLLARLDRFGIVQDIFSVYTQWVLTPARANAKN